MNSAIEWVVVADSGGARILQREGSGGLREMARLRAPQGEGSDARKAEHADRLPRTYDRMGHARHAIEPHRALEDVHAERVAAAIAQHLARALHEQAFARLILVTPPRFAGCLEDKLDASVRARVVARYRKDLRRLSLHGLDAWLAETV